MLANGANVNAIDKSGSTPLILASRLGHEKVVKILLANGANVNLRTYRGTHSAANSTALDLAKTQQIKDLLKAAGATK